MGERTEEGKIKSGRFSASGKNYPPIRDIDNLKEGKHSMVLYDNEELGNLVKYRYIENGLKKGEHCIILTHGKIESVEKELASCDINVEDFKKKKILHIKQIENLIGKDGDELILGFNEILRETTAGLKPPYRVMGRVIPNVSTKKGIITELKLERLFHSTFHNHDCSFLCPYAVNDIEESNRSTWLSELLANHHKLIYATDPKKAESFDPDLLSTFSDKEKIGIF